MTTQSQTSPQIVASADLGAKVVALAGIGLIGYGILFLIQNFTALLKRQRLAFQSSVVPAIMVFCLSGMLSVAIAEAFRISPITVFRTAGLLPPAPKGEEDEARLDDWIHLLKDIDPEDERELRQIAEVKIKRRSNEKLSKSLKSKKAT